MALKQLVGSSIASFSIFPRPYIIYFLATTSLILLHLPSCYSDDGTRSMWKYSQCNGSIADCYEDRVELTSFGDHGSASSLYYDGNRGDHIAYRVLNPNNAGGTKPPTAAENKRSYARSSNNRCPGSSNYCGGSDQ